MKTNNNNSLKMVIAASIGASLIGCAEKNNSTATQVTSTFKVTGSGSAATVAMNKKPSLWNALISAANALVPSSIVDSTGANVNLTSAWTVIKEVEFKTEETYSPGEDELEIEFRGPYFVDLLSNTPVALDTQLIAQKNIRRIKMELEATQSRLPAGAPAALANNSIYLAGSVGGRNFSFRLDEDTSIQIAGPNSFQPSENSELLVEIQLANIFKQMNLSSVTNNEVIDHNNKHTGSNLCLSIDASATDLYTCIRKGLEKHANFGEDRNRNGSLEYNDDHVK